MTMPEARPAKEMVWMVTTSRVLVLVKKGTYLTRAKREQGER